MPVEHVVPTGFADWATVAVAGGTKTVYVPGQTALASDGTVVGEGDPIKQAREAFLSLGRALEGVGLSYANLAKVTVYVVDWKPELLEGVLAAQQAASEDLGGMPLATIVGVTTLAMPGLLIEIEAIAVA